jgi:trehalose/maltose transport system substrate-binding protein
VTASKYNQVSNAFWNSVHDVLSGKARAEDSLARLDAMLNRLGRGGKWE